MKRASKCDVERLEPFDAFEIHPCALIGYGDGTEGLEPCDRDSKRIHCWSLYVHLERGGLECVSDHATEAEAEKALDEFRWLEAMPTPHDADSNSRWWWQIFKGDHAQENCGDRLWTGDGGCAMNLAAAFAEAQRLCLPMVVNRN